MKSDDRKCEAMALRSICCEIKRADAELEEELSFLKPGGEVKRKAIEDALKANGKKYREYLDRVSEIESSID